MKMLCPAVIFILLAALAGISSGQSIPSPTGYVNDQAGLLSPPAMRELEALLTEIAQRTGAEIAVVTVGTVSPSTIEDYAVRLFQQWGIGQKGKDNGVLLLVAAKDREVRIEVGYGLEGAIPDAVAAGIVNRLLLPSFRRGNFEGGITAAARELAALTAREHGVEIAGLDATGMTEEPDAEPGRLAAVIMIFLMLAFMGGMIWLGRKTKGGRGGGLRGGFGGGRSSGGSRGGGRSGGFSGGRSGGGGASGRW